MTTTEAIEILKNASGLAPLTRADHLRIMQAVNILEEALKNLEKRDA